MTETAKKAAANKKPRKRVVAGRVTDPRNNPKEWQRWVIAARDRIIGVSIEDAGPGVGISGRQLKNWMKHEAWQDALKEAEEVCLQNIKHHSIAAVFKSVKRGNADLGERMMTKLMPQLQPKKDEGGGPTSVTLNLGFGARGPVATPEREGSDVPAIRSA